jgi:predicted metal-dependent HD superfamily phosphohydrolase
MNYAKLLEEVKHEALGFFHQNKKTELLYHSQGHTEFVVSRAAEIGRFYQLNDRDFFIVITAAWFHDRGYYMGSSANHELRGAEAAAAFLSSKELDEPLIQDVKRCIMATKMPQKPTTLLEQILCDADLYHLGTDQFSEMNKKMRKELEVQWGKKVNKQEWRLKTLELMEAHRYHTDYARNLLQNQKEQNIQHLKMKAAASQDEAAGPVPGEAPAPVVPPPPSEAAKKPKSDRPDRGIETMFRISSNNHQRLSDMADNKANIMITTNSIILSILLSVMLRKLEDNQHLLIPTLLLLAVCVVTMVSCILATRPAIPEGTFSKQDIDEKKVNLLFFGNFYRMSYDEYLYGMVKMMNDREFLYGSLTRDLYSQGVVLGRKYRLLRIGYNVFMYGITISVIAYVAAVMYFMA